MGKEVSTAAVTMGVWEEAGMRWLVATAKRTAQRATKDALSDSVYHVCSKSAVAVALDM